MVHGVVPAAMGGGVSLLSWADVSVWTLGLALVLGASYVASLYLHPFANCRRCRGTARHRGLVFGYAHRPCERCNGTGKKVRLGRTFFGGRP